MAKTIKKAPANQQHELLDILKKRFEKNMKRHPDCQWDALEAKLKSASSGKKWLALNEMEQTGGEPDVVDYDKKTNEFIFYDCSAESPSGRRSICYDREGLQSRKEHAPANSAVDMAKEMGIDILTEEQYRAMQELGDFDLKTSSWILTPPAIRKHGGAIFSDRRYGHVFTYHNGAQSYYASRGFRGALRV